MTETEENKINPMLQRFLRYLETKEIAPRKAEEMLHAGNGRLGKMKVNGTEIKTSFMEKILLTFPDLNQIWLAKGSGEMLIDRKAPKNNINAKRIGSFDYPMESDERVVELGEGKYSFIVPKVSEYGYAGYVVGWKDPEYIEHLPKHMAIVDHPPQGEYLAVEVSGVSMENWTSEEMAKQSLREGEVVTGRNIPHHYWKNRFHIHKFKDFIIIHQEGILIKRVVAHDVEKGIITCHSLNPDKGRYPDFELDLREVKQILNIVQPRR